MQVGRAAFGQSRGGRVRNTWGTCPEVGDIRRKRRAIPHELDPRRRVEESREAPWEGPAAD